MAKVHLWSGLRRFAGGQEVIDIPAQNLGGVFRGLIADYPGLEPFIEDGVSVAIDGDILPPDPSLSVGLDTEIHLLQQMKGG